MRMSLLLRNCSKKERFNYNSNSTSIQGRRVLEIMNGFMLCRTHVRYFGKYFIELLLFSIIYRNRNVLGGNHVRLIENLIEK